MSQQGLGAIAQPSVFSLVSRLRFSDACVAGTSLLSFNPTCYLQSTNLTLPSYGDFPCAAYARYITVQLILDGAAADASSYPSGQVMSLQAVLVFASTPAPPTGMTDTNTGGYTVTASSSYSAGFHPWQAMDRVISPACCSWASVTGGYNNSGGYIGGTTTSTTDGAHFGGDVRAPFRVCLSRRVASTFGPHAGRSPVAAA